MNFGRALDVLKRDGIVRRESWPAQNWLMYAKGYMPILKSDGPYRKAMDAMGETDSHMMILPRVDMHSAQGMLTGWLPTTADMLADDWIVTLETYLAAVAL